MFDIAPWGFAQHDEMTGDSRIAPTIKKEKTNKTAGRQWQPLRLKFVVILHKNVGGGACDVPLFEKKQSLDKKFVGAISKVPLFVLKEN